MGLLALLLLNPAVDAELAAAIVAMLQAAIAMVGTAATLTALQKAMNDLQKSIDQYYATSTVTTAVKTECKVKVETLTKTRDDCRENNRCAEAAKAIVRILDDLRHDGGVGRRIDELAENKEGQPWKYPENPVGIFGGPKPGPEPVPPPDRSRPGWRDPHAPTPQQIADYKLALERWKEDWKNYKDGTSPYASKTGTVLGHIEQIAQQLISLENALQTYTFCRCNNLPIEVLKKVAEVLLRDALEHVKDVPPNYMTPLMRQILKRYGVI